MIDLLRTNTMLSITRSTLVIGLAICAGWIPQAFGVEVTLVPIKDNTLYEYSPNNARTLFNSNGSGDLFSAGRNRSRSLIRRGLMQFDFSGIPAGSVVDPGTVRLDLYVVNFASHDLTARPFWVVPLAEGNWGEGASAALAGVSGSGSGAAAQDGDATWFHTMFDSAIHDDQSYSPGADGFWAQLGALGNDPLDPQQLFGDPAGIVMSDVGPVSFSSASLEDDVNAWLQGTGNFGWVVLGDETVSSGSESSARGFASREHANPDFRPLLSFKYAIAGDYDGDDLVGIIDLNLVLFNWDRPGNTLPPLWSQQIPLGSVGIDELNGVLFNWNAGATTVIVPEPSPYATLPLLAAACIHRIAPSQRKRRWQQR